MNTYLKSPLIALQVIIQIKTTPRKLMPRHRRGFKEADKEGEDTWRKIQEKDTFIFNKQKEMRRILEKMCFLQARKKSKNEHSIRKNSEEKYHNLNLFNTVPIPSFTKKSGANMITQKSNGSKGNQQHSGDSHKNVSHLWAFWSVSCIC